MHTEYLRYFYLALAVTLAGMATIAKVQCGRDRGIEEEYIEPMVEGFSSYKTFNVGRSIAHFTEEELRMYMHAYGYRDLNQLNLGFLRRVYLAHEYRPMYRQMSMATGLDESVIFSLHIFESTINGIETDLFAEHKNPGGIKYRSRGYKVLWFDDCYDESGLSIPCEFEGLKTYQDMIDTWSEVLNAERYAPCKNGSNIQDTCKCLQESGYHTANSYKQRYNLARQYYELQNHFPVP